jgi:hypothetical protein
MNLLQYGLTSRHPVGPSGVRSNSVKTDAPNQPQPDLTGPLQQIHAYPRQPYGHTDLLTQTRPGFTDKPSLVRVLTRPSLVLLDLLARL